MGRTFWDAIVDIADRMIELGENEKEVDTTPRYLKDRYSDSLEKERALRERCEQLLNDIQEWKDNIIKTESIMYEDDRENAIYNYNLAVKEYKKTRYRYLEQRKKTDKLREKILEGDDCVGYYDPDERYREEDFFSDVGGYVGREFYRLGKKNPWIRS